MTRIDSEGTVNDTFKDPESTVSSTFVENGSSNSPGLVRHFTGNLMVYRREFVSAQSADSANRSCSSRQDLVRRYRTKTSRLASRQARPLSASPLPACAAHTGAPVRYEPWKAPQRKFVAAMVGCLFVGVAVGRLWDAGEDEATVPLASSAGASSLQASDGRSALSSSAPSMSMTGGVTPDVLKVSSTRAASDAIDMANLKKRIGESHLKAEKYRNEASMLRDQVSSLTSENTAYAAETLALNRELLDLEVTVLALQSKQVSESNTTPRVVYNFVDVPIGGDPDAIYDAGSGDLASSPRVNNSSYNNSPGFTNHSQDTTAQAELEEALTQQYTDGPSDEPSDEYLDELIGRMIAEGGSLN